MWYDIAGPIDMGLPIVAVTGGPGDGDLFFTPLKALASEHQAVVTYHQVDCGRSTGPNNPDEWTIQLFVDQLDGLRRHLGVDKIISLGQSWGGWLAQEYTFAHPDAVAGLVLSSTSASVDQCVTEAQHLVDAMPPDLVATIRHHEAAGTTEHPNYQAASMAFVRRHACRLDPCS